MYLETRLMGKENKVTCLASCRVHVCVCLCVCPLPIFYFNFQEKCNKTEVEMNVGALQPRRV